MNISTIIILSLLGGILCGVLGVWFFIKWYERKLVNNLASLIMDRPKNLADPMENLNNEKEE